MKRQYELDFACRRLNAMGWSSEKKKNINSMCKAFQKIPSYVTKHGEAAAVFSVVSEKKMDELVYEIDGAMGHNVYDGREWNQDIHSIIKANMDKHGVDASNYQKSNLKLCVWHNHHAGTGFSIADMKTMVDFYPLISEAFLDVNTIHRMVPNKKLEAKLCTESGKSEFLLELNQIQCELYQSSEFIKELDALFEKHSKLYECAIKKEKNIVVGSVDKDYNEGALIDAFNNDYKELKERFRDTYESRQAYFHIVKLTKKIA